MDSRRPTWQSSCRSWSRDLSCKAWTVVAPSGSHRHHPRCSCWSVLAVAQDLEAEADLPPRAGHQPKPPLAQVARAFIRDVSAAGSSVHGAADPGAASPGAHLEHAADVIWARFVSQHAGPSRLSAILEESKNLCGAPNEPVRSSRNETIFELRGPSFLPIAGPTHLPLLLIVGPVAPACVLWCRLCRWWGGEHTGGVRKPFRCDRAPAAVRGG